MKKPFTKIICVIVAVIVAAGLWLFAGCSNFYTGGKLTNTDGDVASNGGFAVEKGEYLYFINGSATYTADNTYGVPVKGSIVRISKDDLAKHNYASVETVVPLVVYSGNSNAGIYIYGDYIYYATPSTEKNSDGEILNTKLDFKRSRIDGSETMKDYFLQVETNSTEYRYVEVGGTVYLVYVATSETLYDESTGVTNLHSLNVETGEDTLLAYNIASVMFDDADKTNPRIYYTMSVTDYAADSEYNYNQVYTVRADATADKFAETDFVNDVLGWDEDTDHYINCGDLVFDGIGYTDGTGDEATVFNYDATGATRNLASYTYTLAKYTDGTLFYTRTTTNNTNAYLFMLSESDLISGSAVKSGWNPVTENPTREMRTLTDGSSAANYTYLFDDNGVFLGVIIAESNGGLTVNYAYTESGAVKLGSKIGANNDASYFYILREGTATVLFVDGDYLYYSLSGGNGYTVYRLDWTGRWGDYDGMPAGEEVDDYNAVRILDLDAASDWYLPELVDGQLIFAGETDDMSSYNYIMVCDLRNADGKIMTNAEIDALNELFESVEETISDYSDTDTYPTDVYANLSNAARYVYYTGDVEYVKQLAELCNAAAKEEDEDADDIYSDKTLAKLDDFLAAKGDWADFAAKSREVNGTTVYSNSRDYYYSILGKMSDGDAEDYIDALRSSYLQSEPAEEETWWESLSTAAKAWIIVGIVVGALVVIAGVTVLVILLVRRNKRKNPEQRRKRIKVDTTDDKDIDVYASDDETTQQ